MNKQFKKDGKIKQRKHIVLHIDNEDGTHSEVFNPSDELLALNGWVEYKTPEPTEEQKLNSAKHAKKRDVEIYINNNKAIYVNDVKVNISEEELNKIFLRVLAEDAMNKSKTNLWLGNQKFETKTKDALNLIYQLMEYFGQFDDLQREHQRNIDNLATTEEVDAYDFTSLYPERVEVHL